MVIAIVTQGRSKAVSEKRCNCFGGKTDKPRNIIKAGEGDLMAPKLSGQLIVLPA